MASPSDFTVGELRYINRTTTFNKTFTAADAAAWAADSAVKLRAYDVDTSGLTMEMAPDPQMQTRHDGRSAPIRVKRGGSFKFKMHLSGGSADTTPTSLLNLMGACMGGLYSPAAISDAVEADSTVTHINATAHGLKDGQAVLVGVVGDAGGGGKCSVIADESGSGANDFDLALALPAAPAAEAVIKAGHTVYLDPTVDWYSDFLFVGSHAGTGATDDGDQLQAIGCAGKFSIGGLAAGETPFVEFEFFPGDWQWVAYADQASFSHTTAWVGGNPIYSAAEGQLMIQDLATTTRNEIKGGDIELDFGFYDLTPIVDYNAPNNIGGWKRIRTDQGPRLTVKAYWTHLADMPGLYNDVIAGTAKQVLLQIGNVTQATLAIYLQRAFLQGLDPSMRVEYEKNTALQLTFEAANGTASLLADAHDKLQDTAFALCLL